MNTLAALLLIFCSGCATVHFRANDEIPVSFVKNPAHTKQITVHGVSKFYLGGLIPKQHDVFIDHIVKEAGYREISGLKIYEERDIPSLILKFLTLGIYLPTSHTFVGYTTGDALSQRLSQSIGASEPSPR